jgi:Flp pilus assembly protein TadB
MEMIILAAIALFTLEYQKRINTNKFIKDNIQRFKVLKEDDYDFLVKAKYGENVDPEVLYTSRVKNSGLVIIVIICFFVYDLSFINMVLAFVVGYLVFKSQYKSLKSYYKKHLNKINLMLPYFLKTMEILAQHYTIPVALSRSIISSPDIFKPGLRELVEKINAGDSSVDPYMEFAKQYPVTDSVRMMRLLYRLGLGGQEEKHEQLIMFSRGVSSLQNKAREQRYKDRLKVMENKTMLMLGVTGGGVMILLLLSVFTMMSF